MLHKNGLPMLHKNGLPAIHKSGSPILYNLYICSYNYITVAKDRRCTRGIIAERILTVMRKYYITILCGLFIAIQVVFRRILAIDLVFMRINLEFIPIAIGGAILGPMWNGIICAAADIIGFLLTPNPGVFFPGFTLSEFIKGVAYGYFFTASIPFLDNLLTQTAGKYARKQKSASGSDTESESESGKINGAKSSVPVSKSAHPLSTLNSLLVRTAFAAFIVTLPVEALLNTLWVSILYKRAFMFYFGTRLIKALIMFPVHIAAIGVIWRTLGKYIESFVFPKIAAQ